jgi:pimeloyl-ACP methyl ester carboxylesterase
MSEPQQRTGSARPGTRRTAVLVAIVVLLGTVGLLGASPADARTDNKTKPVLFVHGYNPTSNSTDCGADFDSMINNLRSQGFTGPMVKIGFYSGDYNCNVNLRSYGSFGNSSSWKEIAKAFSKYIHAQYTSKGIAVDVVGYSMGGLIARGAVWGAQKGESGFSAPIDVEDVVTLGTPHNGAAWYSYLCLWGQCATLKPGATDIKWLQQNGNPQGRYGTEFTTIGSNGDAVVPSSSAVYMSIPSGQKVIYSNVPHTGSNNYMKNSTVVTRSANALAYVNQ